MFKGLREKTLAVKYKVLFLKTLGLRPSLCGAKLIPTFSNNNVTGQQLALKASAQCCALPLVRKWTDQWNPRRAKSKVISLKKLSA